MPTLRPIPRPKVPRVGRPTGKFTQHRRLDVLKEKLEAHAGGLSLEELAAMLRITTRSVRRYLRELALVTELESIEVRRGGAHLWRIKPSERGRTVALRRTQAYALLASRRVFDPIRGSALFDEIDVALRQVEQVAHRPAVRTAGARRGRERRAARRALRLRSAVAPGLRQPRRGRGRAVPGRRRAAMAALPLPGGRRRAEQRRQGRRARAGRAHHGAPVRPRPSRGRHRLRGARRRPRGRRARFSSIG